MWALNLTKKKSSTKKKMQQNKVFNRVFYAQIVTRNI
uniref:Uncharacterized protein n=1 Tax=Rhizophora mucronata TaxID=61149 RepID=A0A2P2N209_RHIMU